MSLGDPHDTDADDVEVELVRAVLSQRLFGATEARIGRFIVLRQLGAGGVGVVYAAYDPELDRKVAVKLMHADESDGSEGRVRMMREAQALAKLSHPNVVGVHEIGEHREQVFVAMEFIEGMTLRAWWAAAPRGWREVLDVMCQAGRGLVAAPSRSSTRTRASRRRRRARGSDSHARCGRRRRGAHERSIKLERRATASRRSGLPRTGCAKRSTSG